MIYTPALCHESIRTARDRLFGWDVEDYPIGPSEQYSFFRRGGQVMAPPFDVMENGRMAVVTDPAGAHFALWQPKTHAGTGVTGEEGTVNLVEFSVPDRSKVMKFYEDLFGWKMVTGMPIRRARYSRCIKQQGRPGL